MDWKEIVKGVAPVLGTALTGGSPFGGMAAKWLTGKLIGDENAGEEALEQVITSANPDTMVKLKQLDIEFKKFMRDMDIKEEQLHAQDRGSARDMGAKTTLIPQMTISAVYILAFAWILYFVFTTEVEFTTTQLTIVNVLIGILSAGLVQILNFWFGSSSGSKEKTAKMIVTK